MGYKSEQFVKNIDENLQCPICHEVFTHPLSCKDGHTFCSVCITEWLKTKKKCPLDNRGINLKKLVRNLSLEGIIDNLEVFCNSQDADSEEPRAMKRVKLGNGERSQAEMCEWNGKLKHLKQHTEACPFQYASCSYDNCTKLIRRREMEEHKRICEYRTAVCKECLAEVIEHELVHHQDNDCPNALISCPNKCRGNKAVTQVRRDFMKEHLTEICGMESVPCVFANQGCSEQVLRKHLEKHLQDKISSHMLLLSKQSTELKDELKKVKETLVKFEDRLPTNGMYMWKIDDFKSLANTKQKGSKFESPIFLLCGHKWKLKIFPNGTDQADKGLISLFLAAIDGEDGSQLKDGEITVVFRLEVLSFSNKPNRSSYSNHTFTKEESDWGWKHFMKSSDALSLSHCNDSKGNLYIQCSIQLF